MLRLNFELNIIIVDLSVFLLHFLSNILCYTFVNLRWDF